MRHKPKRRARRQRAKIRDRAIMMEKIRVWMVDQLGISQSICLAAIAHISEIPRDRVKCWGEAADFDPIGDMTALLNDNLNWEYPQ